MQTETKGLLQQPQVAILTGCAALIALCAVWIGAARTLENYDILPLALIGIFLIAADVVTYRFPIHIRHNSKIYIGSITRFLMVAVLPPPLAAAAIGLSTFVGDKSEQKKRGLFLSDIVTDTGRGIIIAWLASTTSHFAHAGHAVARLVEAG